MSKITLTAVVPTSASWTDVEDVVHALVPSVAELGIEIVIGCASPNGPPPPERSGVVMLSVDTTDLFVARAAAVGRASGDIIALLEDHAIPDSTWARSVTAAWEAHPEAAAIVHTIAVSPCARIWELTLFTITFGPFLAVDRLPGDRLPVPGIVSFRRTLLPHGSVAPGWIEYEMLPPLIEAGVVVMDASIAPIHVQPVTWRAPWLSFNSGRMYSGSLAKKCDAKRLPQFQRIWRDTRTVFSQTVAARRRMHANTLGAGFVMCLVALLSAHACGQIVGAATRSVGRSGSALQ